jgi:hypothetical protein
VSKRLLRTIPLLGLLWVLPATLLHAQLKGDYLSEDEEDELRNAQGASERIEVYIKLQQARLDTITSFRAGPMDSRYDNGGYIDKLLGQYISLTDEMKDWIQDHYDRKDDMRAGLRKFTEEGPKQLEELHRIQQTPDAYTHDYRRSLSDAMDDLNDALNGATQALADQQKLFGELKREEKAEKQTATERRKEAKKREKEERKLLKRERKKHPPTDQDQD